MANRVLLGNHPTYGYGCFISEPTKNVLSSTRSDLIFSTEFEDSNTGIISVDGIGFNIVQSGTVSRTTNNTTSDSYTHLRTIENIYFPKQLLIAKTKPFNYRHQ